MYIIISFAIIILLISLYNKVYFFFIKKITFFHYLKFFILFNLFLFFLLQYLYFKFEYFESIRENDLKSIFFIYILTYLSFFLTVGLKSVKSPSEEIFIKIKNKISIKKLHLEITKKKIIKNRIKDLVRQNLILKKKHRRYHLSNSGIFFVRIFLFLKKIFNTKIEG